MGLNEVIAEQKRDSYIPYVRCHIYAAGLTYTTNDVTRRLMSFVRTEEPYKQTLEVVLSNADGALNNIIVVGDYLHLGLGFMIDDSPDYIAQPAFRIVGTEFDSRPGVLTCTLKCRGIIDFMSEDRASETWQDDLDNPLDPSYIVEAMIAGTLSPYSGAPAIAVDWTAITKATDIDFYKPGDGFNIARNSIRLNKIKSLLDNSYVFMRLDNGYPYGTIDFVKPVTTGIVYDYVFELTGDHTFFGKTSINPLSAPDGVTVYGGDYDEDTGTYEYSASVGGTRKFFVYFSLLGSNAECDTVADAIYFNIAMGVKQCEAVVPINCNAKLFDYCKIIDSRDGIETVGNIGHIRTELLAGEYRMTIRFGGWASDRLISDILAKGLTSARREKQVEPFQWIPINCLMTYLKPSEYIEFHTFPMLQSASLYVYSYSAYATSSLCPLILTFTPDGGVETQVWYASPITWNKLATPQSVYESTGSGVWRFKIRNNSGGNCRATAFVAFAMR